MTRPFLVHVPILVKIANVQHWRDASDLTWTPENAELTVHAGDATDAASKVAKALESLVAGKRGE